MIDLDTVAITESYLQINIFPLGNYLSLRVCFWGGLTASNPVICATYHGLNLINGIGTHVKKTVTRRKDFLPQTSDSAPISGALMKDKKP